MNPILLICRERKRNLGPQCHQSYRRVLVDLPGFEIPVPGRVGVLGVLTAALAVVAFIAGVFGLGA